MSDSASQLKKHDFKTSILQGLSAAWPICLGYIPIGLAFGVLAQKAGLHPLEIMLMSILVFAGSSQFIAVSMLSAGAGAVSIIITTFAVNLRHLLMSSSLAVFLGNTTRKKLSLFAYGVTDESFAVNHTRFSQKIWGLDQALVVNHTANIAWVVSSVIGGYSGRFIHEGAFGIDYALTAMFICLLIFQLRGRFYVITAVIAGVSAVILSLIIPGSSYIVLASIFAATTVLGIKKMGATMIHQEVVWVILGMGLVTYVPRWFPLMLLSRRNLPKWLVDWLDLIPAAILSALLVPELVTNGMPRHMSLWQPELWVAIPTFIFALKTKSLGGTVVVGMMLFWLARSII